MEDFGLFGRGVEKVNNPNDATNQQQTPTSLIRYISF